MRAMPATRVIISRHRFINAWGEAPSGGIRGSMHSLYLMLNAIKSVAMDANAPQTIFSVMIKILQHLDREYPGVFIGNDYQDDICKLMELDRASLGGGDDVIRDECAAFYEAELEDFISFARKWSSGEKVEFVVNVAKSPHVHSLMGYLIRAVFSKISTNTRLLCSRASLFVKTSSLHGSAPPAYADEALRYLRKHAASTFELFGTLRAGIGINYNMMVCIRDIDEKVQREIADCVTKTLCCAPRKFITVLEIDFPGRFGRAILAEMCMASMYHWVEKISVVHCLDAQDMPALEPAVAPRQHIYFRGYMFRISFAEPSTFFCKPVMDLFSRSWPTFSEISVHIGDENSTMHFTDEQQKMFLTAIHQSFALRKVIVPNAHLEFQARLNRARFAAMASYYAESEFTPGEILHLQDWCYTTWRCTRSFSQVVHTDLDTKSKQIVMEWTRPISEDAPWDVALLYKHRWQSGLKNACITYGGLAVAYSLCMKEVPSEIIEMLRGKFNVVRNVLVRHRYFTLWRSDAIDWKSTSCPKFEA